MSQQEHDAFARRSNEDIPQQPPITFFDIDGTLVGGLTITSFAQYLTDGGNFNPDSWNRMQQVSAVYANSQKRHKDYEKFAIGLVNRYANGLKGKATEDIAEKAKHFFEEAMQGRIPNYEILEFAKPLVDMMKKHGATVAVSGSPVEGLQPLAKFLGFDELRATTSEIKNGSFTGNPARNLAIDTNKEAVVDEYIDRFNPQTSFGFGDTTHDAPLLRRVRNPYVLGGNSASHEMAIQNGWEIISNPNEVLSRVQNRLASFKK